MKKGFKTVNEMSKITGVTIRTLHYYDEINLLKPSENSEAGYRLYSDEDIEILHQIMFLKEIGFELKQINDIIYNPEFDKTDALKKHKEILIMKKEHIENLIKLVDSKLKGDTNLSFSEFDETNIVIKQKEYYEEVLKRWGNTKEYKEFESKKYKTKNEFKNLDKKVKEIFGQIATCMELPPSCEKVQKLVSVWQKYITENYYNCSNEMLQCLALMYVEDERFKTYINNIADNLAEYIKKAIDCYCDREVEK